MGSLWTELQTFCSTLRLLTVPDGFSLSWSRVRKGRLVIGGLLSVNVGGGAGRPIGLALNTSLGWGLTKVCPPVRLAAKFVHAFFLWPTLPHRKHTFCN
ncbi:hypothetical protein NE237_014242 [Protea cynaroides]|nr:hypothetical protein NE237_014242 [Protea cynaroides]